MAAVPVGFWPSTFWNWRYLSSPQSWAISNNLFHSRREELRTLLPSLRSNIFAFVLHVVCVCKYTRVGCTHVHTRAEVSCWRRMSSSTAVRPIHWPLSLDSMFAQQELDLLLAFTGYSCSLATVISLRETLPEASSCLSHARTRNHTSYRPLFFFLYLKVWWSFFLKNAYTSISINCYLKISGPQGSECLALHCFGCMVLGRDGRCGKSTLTWSSHDIAKCEFRTLPPSLLALKLTAVAHRLYFCLPGVCRRNKSEIQKLSHSVMFLCVIPSYISSLFKF